MASNSLAAQLGSAERQHEERTAPGGAPPPVLGSDVLRLVVARITDGRTRRMLRASSAGLRSLVDSTTTKLVFKGTRDATPAMQHVAERCQQWLNLECVVLVRPYLQCASALMQLLGALGRHCAGFRQLSTNYLPQQIASALASFLGAFSTAGCLTQLTSLDLVPDGEAGSLLLSPLGRLAALTSLRFAGCADAASGSWLPPGLRKLRLASRGHVWPGIGGASWLDCVGACTGLESLQLLWLEARDLGIEPHLDDGLATFYGALKQLTRLTELTGSAKEASMVTESDDSEDEEAEVRFDGFECGRLLSAAPYLRRLAFYVFQTGIFMQLRPAVQGSLNSLRSHAAHLEELAVCVVGPAPSPPSFPRLHTLHASFEGHQFCADMSMHAVFPALCVLTLGTAWDGYEGIVACEAVATLTALKQLCVVAAPPHSELELEGRLDALFACGLLQRLQLCSIKGISFAELLELSRAPQLRQVVVEGCTFDTEPKPRALEVALKACAGRQRAFQAVARAGHPRESPCLLGDDAFHCYWD